MIRDLEVRQCRVLVAVAAQGGVGAAARVLGVAQSTVSEALLSLERLTGAPMTLRRAGREAVLTAAAEALLPHARAMIATSEAALAASAQQAVIRLGTVESISSFLLPEPLSAFRQTWPQVDVRITIGLCEDLRKRVARAELDAALTIEGVSEDKGEGDAIFPAQLRLVAAPDHPLTASIVGRSDLAGQTCLLTDSEGAFDALMRGWIGGVAQPRLESAGSVDGVKRGVLKGEAVGLLPDYAVAEELASGALIALTTREPLPLVALRLTTLGMQQAASPLASLTGRIREALI